MKLRIVVPVFNEGRELAQRLAALQPLRARGAELVVVDGGSDDESWLIASACADRVLLAPRGRGAQLNHGATAAQADVLLLLHADTALPPDADTLVREAIASGASWGWFDARIAGRHWALRTTERLMNLRARLTGVATGDQGLFVTRAAFQQSGGYPDQPLMEDIEMCRRLRRIGPGKTISTPVLTSGRRWLAAGPVRTILLMWALRARYALGADPHTLAARYGYGPRPHAAAAGVSILAKAPVAGFAKTRLAPALGAAGAARVQRRMTLACVHACTGSGLGPVTLWCAPHERHRFFRAVQAANGVALRPQPAGDLGARLAAAMRTHFELHPHLPLLLLGTDCPALAPGQLHEAARTLHQTDAVVIPAEDGGYVLIGMRRPLPALFTGVAWSTSLVLQQTRERLAEAGASWRELPSLWDVDEPADWQRLAAMLPSGGSCRP